MVTDRYIFYFIILRQFRDEKLFFARLYERSNIAKQQRSSSKAATKQQHSSNKAAIKQQRSSIKAAT